MNLRDQRAAAIKAAKGILDGATAESRDLTEDEQSAIDGKMAEVKDLDVKIKGAELAKSVMALTGGGDEDEADDKPAKSLGEHFAKSVGESGFARLKSIGGYTASAPEYRPTGAKAATDPHTVEQFQSVLGTPYLTDVDTSWVRAYRPGPVVADLFGSGSIGGNAVTYFVEGALEGTPGMVAEGAQKPQLHLGAPTSKTDALKKIAAWWDMSDEMVEDLPFLVSEINQRALYQLGQVEETQLLSGSGTGSNVLGLLNRSGIQTEAATAAADNADAIFRAMTKVQTATGLSADGVVINPVDYQALRLSRDANDQYYGGGFFAGQYGNGGILSQPPLWGLRTVVTSAVSAGTVLVGAFAQAATVYRKGGVRVESTNSDAGKFTTNIITTRIEERVALAVRIPSAVVNVTLSNL